MFVLAPMSKKHIKNLNHNVLNMFTAIAAEVVGYAYVLQKITRETCCNAS